MAIMVSHRPNTIPGVKKIVTGDARIVSFVIDFARGQIERCQMRGVRSDIAAVKFREQLDVQSVAIEAAFAIIGPHQEAPAATGRIQNYSVGAPNAESIYNDIVAREMLSPPVALLRADQTLKDAADDVGGNVTEIVLGDPAERAAPSFGGLGVRENQFSRPGIGIVIGIKERFVIAGPVDRERKGSPHRGVRFGRGLAAKPECGPPPYRAPPPKARACPGRRSNSALPSIPAAVHQKISRFPLPPKGKLGSDL